MKEESVLVENTKLSDKVASLEMAVNLILKNISKWCPSCETGKPISGFHKDRTKTDGLCSCCIQCKSAHATECRGRKDNVLRRVKTSRGRKCLLIGLQKYLHVKIVSILKFMFNRIFKRCPTCKTTKLRRDFYKNKSNSDGLHSSCKTCSKAFVSSWQKRHPQKCLAYTNKWNSKQTHVKKAKVLFNLPTLGGEVIKFLQVSLRPKKKKQSNNFGYDHVT